MITSHLLIGILAVAWGSGMIYFSRAKNVPSIVKPFIESWWIRSRRINNAFALIFGIGTLIGGLLYLVGGLMGIRILSFP